MESQKSLKEDWLLWVLVGGAIVLTLSYYLLAFNSGSGQESTRWLFEGVSKQSIQALRKYRGDTLALSIERRRSGDWTITHPEGVEVDTRAVDDWIGTLLNPEVNRRFRASQNADYGIHESSTRLEVVQTRRTHSLHLGGKTPTGQGFYLRYGSAEQAPVFLLAGRTREDIDRNLYDLRDKSLFKRNYRNLDAFSLERGGDSVTYRRGAEGWKIASETKSTLSETDSRDLDDDLRTILTATASSFYDTSTPDAYAPVDGTLHLNFEDGVRRVRFGGKQDNERLVRIDDGPVVGVTRDPVRTLQDLPVKPEGWPSVEEPEPPTNPSQSQSKRPSPEQLKQLRRQMQQSPNRR